ncbi:MAG TPA: GH116 family glycosyl hydrolase, partial [Levilinea sp.]|nr:GH116 family glycosyl hydrolase [Levilinea sp.]
RVAPPGRETQHTFHAAADGQLGGIMKVYREWHISGDRDWLATIYPLAKRSLDFCIEQWDPRRRGLLEEPHHNTYDIEFWGPDGMCTSFYLGALATMSALAHDAGHPEDADAYNELARASAQRSDADLFNGEYYQQKVQYEGLRDTSFVDLLSRFSGDLSEEERLLKNEGPKYQYGSGCLSDGVFGAWLAELCGVKSPQNRENIRRHLQAVYLHNFKPSLRRHVNTQRPGFALGDEPGLLLCTWPRGGKPTLPFVYSDEVWTGIEYQAASHLIYEGLVEEGLAIVKAVRSRYDGHTRNPWNEYECGNYYARSMASYALLIAYSGFRYSAATKTFFLAPKVPERPFRCFFSTASGWGSLTVGQGGLEIDLVEGQLEIERVVMKTVDEDMDLQVSLIARAGKISSISWTDGRQL